MKKTSRLQNWWRKNGQIILMFVIIVLSSVIGYKLGQINNYNNTKIEVTLRDTKNANPAQEEANIAIETLKRQGVDIHQEIEATKKNRMDCLFVASRNSKKYHTKDCRYGKKIKAANLICFKSIEEAKNKGYQPAGGCFKNK
jgi:predicted negative regulator of RcsB-dependent stress response